MAQEETERDEQPNEQELQMRRENMQRRMDNEAAAGFDLLDEPDPNERAKGARK